jgi:hypothetical protein
MKYETFKQIIDLQIAHHKRIQSLYKLKVDLIETFEEQEKAMGLLWRGILTEYGYDWLSWYLYEKNGISGKPRIELRAWDSDQNEICKDLKGLWEYLTQEKYFKVELVDSK